jgi:hypothetical protein
MDNFTELNPWWQSVVVNRLKSYRIFPDPTTDDVLVYQRALDLEARHLRRQMGWPVVNINTTNPGNNNKGDPGNQGEEMTRRNLLSLSRSLRFLGF